MRMQQLTTDAQEARQRCAATRSGTRAKAELVAPPFLSVRPPDEQTRAKTLHITGAVSGSSWIKPRQVSSAAPTPAPELPG